MNPKTKLIIVLVAAAGAVSVAGYIGYTSMGGARTVRSADDAAREVSRADGPGEREEDGPGGRQIEMGGPPPAWVEEERSRDYEADSLEFPSRDDAVAWFDTGVEMLASRAEQESSLGPLGMAARRGLIESWRLFLRPLIAGDQEAFGDAVASMGGETGADADETPADALYDRLSVFFEGARVDLASSRILSRDGTNRGEVPLDTPRMPPRPRGGDEPSGIAIPMMMDIERFADDETGETRDLRSLTIPLAAVFPGAAERSKEGAPTFEVWSPAKLAGAKGRAADMGPSAFFVLNRDSGKWQPVALRVALVSDASDKKMRDLMASRRRATD